MRRWVLTFVIGCVGAVALVYLALWAVGSFRDLGLSVNGIIALTLGTLLTVGLGVGLMALVFYSDRSGRDDEARDFRKDSC